MVETCPERPRPSRPRTRSYRSTHFRQIIAAHTGADMFLEPVEAQNLTELEHARPPGVGDQFGTRRGLGESTPAAGPAIGRRASLAHPV